MFFGEGGWGGGGGHFIPKRREGAEHGLPKKTGKEGGDGGGGLYSWSSIASLEDRRIDQCELFDSIVSNPDHKLHHFLPPKNYCHYNLRRQRHFANPVMRTKRFSSTFLPSMCRR